MQKLIALFDSGEADDWTAERIARELGVNATTLQRPFRLFECATKPACRPRVKRWSEARRRERHRGSSAANVATVFKR
ncbi:hypothetical protein KXR94_16825 [Stutzerimonas stutzeri]